MNWYFYWFYTIYNIYNRFSSDRDFVLFATGIFSIFVSFGLIGCLNLLCMLIGLPKSTFVNEYVFIITGLIILIYNWILFLPKKRQAKYYENYKNKQSLFKDVIAITVSILSVVVFFSAMFIVREYYAGQSIA